MPPDRKLQRWLDLLAALLRRRFPVSFAELKPEVPGYQGDGDEAVRRMFERDKDELRRFGIPIVTRTTDEGESTYELKTRDFYLPFLTMIGAERERAPVAGDRYGYRSLPQLAFEPDELAAIADGAKLAAQLGDPPLADHVESAMRKLAFDLPVDALAPAPIHVRGGVTVDQAVLDTLAGAVRRRKRVTFTYHAIGSDRTSPREVLPYGLFFLNGHWYLAAATADDPTVKNYRVSRMDSVSANEARPKAPDFDVPKGFSLREHARSRHAWELGDSDAEEVTVRFHARNGAVTAAARLGEAIQGAPPDERRFRVRRREAFVRWILSYAGEAEVLGPPAVREAWQQLARETLAALDAPPPPMALDILTVREPERAYGTLAPQPGTAATKLRRLLHLIPLVADDADHRVAELAAQSGLDEETVVKDLMSLADRFNDPGGFLEAVRVTVEAEQVSVRTDHFRRPMRLTLAELAALDLGLAMLAGGERPGEGQAAIARARERLQQAIARVPDFDGDEGVRAAMLSAHADPTTLALARDALRQRRVLTIWYQGAGNEEATARDVRPYALAFARGSWYLVAHCERSHGVRIFRLDRVADAKLAARDYEIPADFTLDAMLDGERLFTGQAPATLRVRYSPRIARWIAERERLAPAADGSVTQELPCADVEWAARHVLQYGPEAQVLAPPEVRDAIRRRLEAVTGG